MKRTITTTVDIDAMAADVWRVLVATDRYGEWNPFIRKLEGGLEKGRRLRATMTPPGGPEMTFKPQVLVAEPERELRWVGHLGVPGLFDGEHAFRIEQLDDGRSRFTQSESFSGVLVRPLRGTLEKTEAGFQAMNEALRNRVEATRTPA